MKEKQGLPLRRESNKQPDMVIEAQTEQTVVPYDENLLDRTRTQWQFGEWQSLAQIDRNTLQHHPDRARIALLAAAGRLQTGNAPEARQFVRLAIDWGVSKKLVSQILVAGVHNSLGRAAAIGNQPHRALLHFENAIRVGASGSDVKLLTQARIAEQNRQLGLPTLAGHPKVSFSKREAKVIARAVVPYWIAEALTLAPDAPPLLIAAAEAAQRGGDFVSAVRYWQRLASVDGLFMQQTYYDRLSEAYKHIQNFPRGSDEEEVLRGDYDKHLLLKRIHQVLRPRSYLEIGVNTGRSLLLATCPAIGIDPMPMVAARQLGNATLVRATSDYFFTEQAEEIIQTPIDLAFIDGMHFIEFALRDFMNIERYANPSTLVVIDDVLPGHAAQAERDRRTRAWTGDIWKLVPILRKYRPDLSLLLLDAYPTGLLCISGLKSGNSELQNAYAEIVAEWSFDAQVPDTVISRAGALSCAHSDLEALLMRLRDIRSMNYN